jgi:hypothetical protein
MKQIIRKVSRFGSLALLSVAAIAGQACSASVDSTSDEKVGTVGEALGTCATQVLPIAAATASSVQQTFVASNAIDGNLNTRWSSAQGMPQWLELDLGSVVFISQLNIDWQTAYATSFQIKASSDNVNFATVNWSTATQSGWQNITGLNLTARYIQIYATGATGYGNVSIVEAQVIGDVNSACPTVETACGQSIQVVPASAQASSQQFSYTPASAAIDNSYSTRWSSNFTDNEWLALDLGGQVRVDDVRISWQSAYAKEYAIQTGTSLSGPWTTVATNNAGKGGVEAVTVGATTQFLRLLGIERATGYGYSVFEIDVYGSRDLVCNNLLTGWNQSASSSNVGGYSFSTTNPNEILFPTSWGCPSPAGPAYFIFTQNVNLPAGNTFQLSLSLTNVGGSVGEAGFSASLAGAVTYTPMTGSEFDGHSTFAVGEVSSNGTIGATFAVNSTVPQTVPLTIETVIPASSAGPNCNSNTALETFTLANATLVKVN